MAMALAFSLSLSACTSANGFSNEKIRYKMTVTVETPEGVKTGYAVREASLYTEPSILPDQGGTFYNITKGEAVIVDLGQRGILFVLLGGDREARAIFKSFAQDKASQATELLPAQYPKIVNFKDRNSPASIEQVIEKKPCTDQKTGIPHSAVCITKDRTQEIYGAGVHLRSIQLEQTGQQVNLGEIKQYLKWFREPGYSLGLKFFDPANPDPAKYLTSDHFQTRAD